MKMLIVLIAAIFGLSSQVKSEELRVYEIDYEKLVFLDAETLAEQGIMDAYEELKSELTKYIDEPAQVKEVLNNETPIYKVISQGETFNIYGPGLVEDEGRSWGRASHAFFSIVNRQLRDLDIRFYAINGGNDLGGIFLTSSQYEAAIKSLSKKNDWPYIPTLEHPRYGQPN